MKIKTDSRKVEKGDTFVAIRGFTQDGHDFIKDAIERGASKIIAERGTYPIAYEIVSDTKQYIKAYVQKYIYPTIKDMKLIGVTGTNGKTTTAFLLYEVLSLLGKKAAYIGTIGFYVEEKVKELSNTTPDILDLYTMLLYCQEQKCEYVVLEVSSHALSFDRVAGLFFDYAIYTNLTQDHLDYHKTMENYALAKEKLFDKLRENGKAIINNDDAYKDRFLKKQNNNITYGKREDSDYQINILESDVSHSVFSLSNREHTVTYETQLLGEYNIYNLTAVLALLMEENLYFTQENIKNLIPPVGRMEKIRYNGSTILIDYAHTPDAVEKVLKCAALLTNGRIYTVIGCGGDRDRSKRPIMAKIATTYSDYTIFTSDNPRSEDPSIIFEDMKKGVHTSYCEWVLDREEAICRAIQFLQKEDILFILGKGHEHYQIIQGEKRHFDDKEMVMKYI